MGENVLKIISSENIGAIITSIPNPSYHYSAPEKLYHNSASAGKNEVRAELLKPQGGKK